MYVVIWITLEEFGGMEIEGRCSSGDCLQDQIACESGCGCESPTRGSDWLIPSNGNKMIQQTEWEGVVQVILRSCVYLVEKKADFTFIWAFSVYVPLEQLAVPAHLPPVCFK